MRIEIIFEGLLGSLSKEKESDESISLSKSIAKINLESDNISSNIRPQTRGGTNLFARDTLMGDTKEEELKEELYLDKQTVPLHIFEHRFAKTALGTEDKRIGVESREERYRITDLEQMDKFIVKEPKIEKDEENNTSLLISKYISQAKSNYEQAPTPLKMTQTYTDVLHYVPLYIYIYIYLEHG